ncbi:MAG: FAD-dependent oxidoreductase [Actinomycetota bacterium]|nr:FAD-dependent oxidoreductase [Actinomycetota bacterium]
MIGGRDDGRRQLVGRLIAEVDEALGVRATVRSVRITRSPDSFPQYRVGQLDRVVAIETALRSLGGPVVVAGASYHGAGIPACIASGRRAAASVVTEVAAGVRI